MALIPPFFLDTVTAIGTRNANQTIHWLGTGFLYAEAANQQNELGEDLYHYYLVTNKHVLKDHRSIVMKINSKDPSAQSNDYPLDLYDLNGVPIWEGHPNPNIDIAIISINPNVLSADNMSYAAFLSDKHTLNKNNLDQLSEGDNIYILGFPMGLVDPTKQYVICRQGCIARIRDYVENKATDFLVDGTVFPGNSGGPVVVRPEITSIEGTETISNANLIGVVKSYLPYEDIAISAQTGNPRVVFQENSGLTQVEPVEHISETIRIYNDRLKQTHRQNN